LGISPAAGIIGQLLLLLLLLSQFSRNPTMRLGLFILFSSLLLLAGCGQKGPLFIPQDTSAAITSESHTVEQQQAPAKTGNDK
jgi:predicted small lipoprotein YifL